MTCLQARDLLPEFAIDGLEPSERNRVEHHVASCPGCSKEVDELREGAAAVALDLATVAPPPELEESVVRGVAHEARRRWLRRRRSARVLVSAAAAAALLSAGAIGGAVAMRGQVSDLRQQVRSTRLSLEQVQSLVQALASNAHVFRTDLMPVHGRQANQGGTGILFTSADRSEWIFLQVLVAHPAAGPYRVLLEEPDRTRVEAGELEPAGRNQYVLFTTKDLRVLGVDPSLATKVIVLDPTGSPLFEGTLEAAPPGGP